MECSRGSQKRIKKNEKKVLTNENECDKIIITLQNTKGRKAAQDLEN